MQQSKTEAKKQELAERVRLGLPVSYQTRYTNCGGKSCTPCRRGGHPHGPYKYAGWKKDGKLQWVYLGKVVVEETNEQSFV